MGEARAGGGSESLLLELALESWRFQKLFVRALSRMDRIDAGRFVNQHRYFVGKTERILADAGMRLIDLEGQPYEIGAAAAALNIDEFGPEDRLIVAETIEPIVMNEAGILRTGTVLVRKDAP